MDKEFIDCLKSKISIVDVVSKKIRLQRSGRDWFGLCPFHKEKTGSLKVSQEKGYYYCFGCGASGDIISFVMDANKINFNEAVEYLAYSYGIPMPERKKTFIDPNKQIYDAINEMKNWFVKQLKEPIGKEAMEYLKSRKISEKSIEKFQLGFAPVDKDCVNYLNNKGISNEILLRTGVYTHSKYKNRLINKYSGRIIFPILNSAGKCVGFGGRILCGENAAKYINSPETEIFVKSDHLYGYYFSKHGGTREIILTEGYLDVISMHQAGFDGAVAPMGTSISETQINMCWNICDTPIIALDGDEAGVKASYRWVDKILPLVAAGKSFKFARFPQGADPDLLISRNQSDVVEAAIKNAMPLSNWIWEGAFMFFPSETPEQKAAIVKALIAKAETIQDIAVKKLYVKALKQKERSLYYKKYTVRTEENIQPVMPAYEKLEKIFIVTIINHPYIIDSVIEWFTKFEFNNAYMQKLKRDILDSYGEYLSGEKEKYMEAILKIKNAVASQLKIQDIILHAKFAGENASDEDAVNGLLKLADNYFSVPLVAEDLKNASLYMERTFSEKDWQRLKALKHEDILIRTKVMEI